VIEKSSKQRRETLPTKTIKPANCDACPFHSRTEGTNLDCNYYHRSGHLTVGNKPPFCKVKIIIINEEE